MRLHTLDDLPKNLKGKRVLVRVDWNVPLGTSGRVLPNARFRIEASRPTIMELLSRNATVVLLAHLGRPDGKPVPAYSLRHIIPAAKRVFHRRIKLLPLPSVRRTDYRLLVTGYSDIFLFENLRFDPGEEANDVGFARSLAAYGDFYVDDAFGNVHRAHASMAALARLLPAVAGRLLEREVQTLSGLLKHPKRPFVAIIGGAKISTKFGVMQSLLRVCDTMLTGGGIANTLLLAHGVEIGASLAEPKFAKKRFDKGKVVLPIWDVVVSKQSRKPVGVRTVNLDQGEAVRADELIVEFGPRTIARYCEEVGKAKTVLWNGVLGVNEVKEFNRGNVAVGKAIAKRTRAGALTVVGGGEMMEVIDALHLRGGFSFCSTGGGAMLEFFEGKELPGIIPLLRKRSL